MESEVFMNFGVLPQLRYLCCSTWTFLSRLYCFGGVVDTKRPPPKKKKSPLHLGHRPHLFWGLGHDPEQHPQQFIFSLKRKSLKTPIVTVAPKWMSFVSLHDFLDPLFHRTSHFSESLEVMDSSHRAYFCKILACQYLSFPVVFSYVFHVFSRTHPRKHFQYHFSYYVMGLHSDSDGF